MFDFLQVALKSLQNAAASQEDGGQRKVGEDEISKENAPPILGPESMVSQAAKGSTEFKAPEMHVTRPTNKTGSASVSGSQKGIEAGSCIHVRVSRASDHAHKCQRVNEHTRPCIHRRFSCHSRTTPLASGEHF